MGYSERLEVSDFRMTPENQEKARDAILQHGFLLASVEENNSLMYHYPLPLSFAQVMKCLGWSVILSREAPGYIDDIGYNREKATDIEEELFTTIAPFVEDDSFMQMMGEDGYQWRWWFKGGVCKQLETKVCWEQFDGTWVDEE